MSTHLAQLGYQWREKRAPRDVLRGRRAGAGRYSSTISPSRSKSIAGVDPLGTANDSVATHQQICPDPLRLIPDRSLRHLGYRPGRHWSTSWTPWPTPRDQPEPAGMARSSRRCGCRCHTARRAVGTRARGVALDDGHAWSSLRQTPRPCPSGKAQPDDRRSGDNEWTEPGRPSSAHYRAGGHGYQDNRPAGCADPLCGAAGSKAYSPIG